MSCFLRGFPPGAAATIAMAVAWTFPLAGCEEERPPPPCFGICDAGPPCDDPYVPPPSSGDADGDGVPDDRDPDADGDGVPNDFENLGGFMCIGPDPDGDGIANWLDSDSDSDGIQDGSEVEGGSDPYVADSDGDGFTDLIERAAGTSPRDATDHPPTGSATLLAPHMGGDVTATVEIANIIENADVFFLVDTTASMSQERQRLIDSIERVIVPALLDAFEDVAFGVAGLDDYPIGEYGDGPDPANANSTGDIPFYLITPLVEGFEDRAHQNLPANICPVGIGPLEPGVDGVPDIAQAFDGLGCHSGNDLPEAFVPALWVTATGSGLSWSGGAVDAQTNCGAGEVGYPCFRPEALPIILLVGDAAFHNGPGGSQAYDFAAPTYEEAIDALNAIGAKVLSVYSGTELPPRLDYESLGRDTGSVDVSGQPLVFDISSMGEGLDTTVVDAMTELAGGVPQDISIDIENGPGNPIDASVFVTGIATADCTTTTGMPPYASRDASTFFAVEGGAHCTFDVTLRNDTVAPTDEPQVFTLIVRARGSGGASFATRRLYVVVARDGDRLVL